MPEFRKDPIVERWVVIAPERSRRPIELANIPIDNPIGIDPFAEGNEQLTPNELLARRPQGLPENGPGWQVRVVPNKFPAVIPDGEPVHAMNGLYESIVGVGSHEVIIECPHDESNLSHLPAAQIGEILAVYRDRLLDLKKDARILHGLIFKNQGVLAGASIRHAHSQLIATPIVPGAIQDEISGSLKYFQVNGESVFDRIIQTDSTPDTRLVFQTEKFIVLCPYASRFPYETWILPRLQQSHFEGVQKSDLDELGHVLKTTLRKLEVVLDDPPYNYILHSAPFDQPELPHFRWHFEILPRTTSVAGYEWGSGCYINPVFPEDAARRMREVTV